MDTRGIGYSILGGRLLGVSRTSATVHAEELQKAGYTARISLQTPSGDHGYVTPPAPHEFLIPDGEAPTEDQMAAICRQIDEWLAAGHRIVVHCTAGIGRTGTILAGYLIWRERLNGDEALIAVREAASTRCEPVETSGQEAFLRAWPRYAASASPWYQAQRPATGSRTSGTGSGL